MHKSLTLQSRMAAHVWEELLAGAALMDAREGSAIFRAGSPPLLAAIVSGLARVFTWTPGGRQLTIRYGRPGDLIGLAALLGGTETWGAQAVTDSTVAIVTHDHLRTLASRDPGIAWLIAEELAMVTVGAVRTAIAAGFRPMQQRVAGHLLEVALPTPDGLLVAPVTHQRLADAVGTAREVITRVLGELREAGVIDTRHGRIVITDATRLASTALAGEPHSETTLSF